MRGRWVLIFYVWGSDSTCSIGSITTVLRFFYAVYVFIPAATVVVSGGTIMERDKLHRVGCACFVYNGGIVEIQNIITGHKNTESLPNAP